MKRNLCGFAAAGPFLPLIAASSLAVAPSTTATALSAVPVVLKIAGVKHWLWRAVDHTGVVLDVLVQRRRDKRLLRKLLWLIVSHHVQPKPQ
jgi:hypothetical protein